MNTLPDHSDSASDGAQATLDRLDGRVTAMRAVLVQLLQDVVVAESHLDRSQADQLLEANEHLVISALDAQTAADTASGALDEAARVSGLDPLTGLPNRTVLLDRFEAAIGHAKRHGNRVALLFVDLDAFKQINDSLGHAAGDRALQLVADCLSSLVRETDTVSRHGGDEFLILLAEVAHADDAALVAEKVNVALGAHARLEHPLMRLQASIGVSVYPEDGEDAKTLIARADAAMYRAKQQESGGFGFHDRAALAADSPQRMALPFETAIAEPDQRQKNLRDANERLVLAALGAQELLAAAEQARRRQSELLALVEEELSNPFAPIRVAAATLGIPGADAALLPRVQAVIEEQAEKMARLVRGVLKPQDPAKKDRTEGA